MTDQPNIPPHDTTDFGRRQDEFLEEERPKGDIRDLYAYYRFSDHEATNLVIQDKEFKKEPVWFEGHMDWHFRRCEFKERFYFGVEGDRLTEDTRETEYNPEPFPPYGYNALNFEYCIFKESFEIADNCVVIFQNCTFEEGVEQFFIRNNCKVEFLDCIFESAVTFEENCEARFVKCQFSNTKLHYVKASENCKLHFQKSYGSEPKLEFLTVENGCEVYIHGDQSWTSSESRLIKAVNKCQVKVYGMSSLNSEKDICISLDNSIFEAYQVTSISSGEGGAIKGENSSVILHQVGSVICEKGITVELHNSTFKTTKQGSISSQEGNTFDISDSEVWINNLTQITSGKGDVFVGDNSKIHVFDTPNLTTNEGSVFNLYNSILDLNQVENVTTAQGTSIYLSSSELECNLVENISSAEGLGLESIDSYLALKNTTRIFGKSFGLNIVGGTLEIQNITEIISSEGTAFYLELCACNIRSIGYISGKLGGFITKEIGGFIEGLGPIYSENGIAVHVNHTNTLEWYDTQEISSKTNKALSVEGDLYRFRMSTIPSLSSESGEALSWRQTSGIASLDTISSIESDSARAALLQVLGTSVLEVRDINTIFSEVATALETEVDGELRIIRLQTTQSEKEYGWFHSGSGKLSLIDIGDIIASEQTGFVCSLENGSTLEISSLDSIVSTKEIGWSINASGSDIRCANIGSVSSTEKNALNITLANSEFRVKSIGTISSTEDTALIISATNSTVYVFGVANIIESAESLATHIVSTDSKIEFQQLGGFYSDKADAVNISVTGGEGISFYQIGEIHSKESTAFLGNCSSKLILDSITSIKTESGKGLDLTFSSPDSLCKLKHINEISGNTLSGDLLSISGAKDTILEGIQSITAQEVAGFLTKIQGFGIGFGTIQIRNCPDISSSTADGGVKVLNTGKFSLVCEEEKGVIDIGECTSEGALIVNDAAVHLHNWSEIKCSETGYGIFIDNSGYAADYVDILGVENIEGGSTGAKIVSSNKVVFGNVATIKAPQGDEGLILSGVADFSVKNSDNASPLTVEAKSSSSTALSIDSEVSNFCQAYLRNITTEDSKGEVHLKAINAQITDCEFNGATYIENADIQVTQCEFKKGLSILDSTINGFRVDVNTIDISFTIENSTGNFYELDLSGNKSSTFKASSLNIYMSTLDPTLLSFNDVVLTLQKSSINCTQVFTGISSNVSYDKVIAQDILISAESSILNFRNYEGTGISSTASKTIVNGAIVDLSGDLDLFSSMNTVCHIGNLVCSGRARFGEKSSSVLAVSDIAGDLENRDNSSILYLGKKEAGVGGDTSLSGTALLHNLPIAGDFNLDTDSVLEGELIEVSGETTIGNNSVVSFKKSELQDVDADFDVVFDARRSTIFGDLLLGTTCVLQSLRSIYHSNISAANSDENSYFMLGSDIVNNLEVGAESAVHLAQTTCKDLSIKSRCGLFLQSSNIESIVGTNSHQSGILGVKTTISNQIDVGVDSAILGAQFYMGNLQTGTKSGVIGAVSSIGSGASIGASSGLVLASSFGYDSGQPVQVGAVLVRHRNKFYVGGSSGVLSARTDPGVESSGPYVGVVSAGKGPIILTGTRSGLISAKGDSSSCTGNTECGMVLAAVQNPIFSGTGACGIVGAGVGGDNFSVEDNAGIILAGGLHGNVDIDNKSGALYAGGSLGDLSLNDHSGAFIAGTRTATGNIGVASGSGVTVQGSLGFSVGIDDESSALVIGNFASTIVNNGGLIYSGYISNISGTGLSIVLDNAVGSPEVPTSIGLKMNQSGIELSFDEKANYLQLNSTFQKRFAPIIYDEAIEIHHN